MAGASAVAAAASTLRTQAFTLFYPPIRNAPASNGRGRMLVNRRVRAGLSVLSPFLLAIRLSSPDPGNRCRGARSGVEECESGLAFGLRRLVSSALVEPGLLKLGDQGLEIGFLDSQRDRLVGLALVELRLGELGLELGEVLALPLQLPFERLDLLAQGRKRAAPGCRLLPFPLAVRGGLPVGARASRASGGQHALIGVKV